MLFSVIVPTYNRAELLDRCLQSLVDQTFKDFEVLVCDDGSNDNSAEVSQKYASLLDIKYIWNENWGGPARPRNIGIAASKGEWICFLDSDDWWTPDKLEACLPYVDCCDLIYHRMQIFSQDKGLQQSFTQAYLPVAPIFETMLRLGNCITNSSVAVRRTVAERVGPLSEDRDFIAVEDFDYWLRIAQTTDRFCCLDRSLGYYWIGDSSISFNEQWFGRQERIYAHYLAQVADHRVAKEIKARQAYRVARNYGLYGRYNPAIAQYKIALCSQNLMTKLKSFGFMSLAFAKRLMSRSQ